jgi:hypothetical protein
MTARKFTRREVLSLRYKALTVPIARLAERERIDPKTLRRLVTGQTYTDIPGALDPSRLVLPVRTTEGLNNSRYVDRRHFAVTLRPSQLDRSEIFERLKTAFGDQAFTATIRGEEFRHP